MNNKNKKGILSSVKIKESAVCKGFYYLEEDLIYVSKSGHVIIVPKGFITDLITIPEIWKPYIQDEKYHPAGIVHDYLYSPESKVFDKYGKKILITQKYSDDIFFEILDIINKEHSKTIGFLSSMFYKFLNIAMYCAVRMFGAIFFYGKKRNINN